MSQPSPLPREPPLGPLMTDARGHVRRLVLVAILAALVARVSYVLVQTGVQLFDVSFVAADSRLYLEIAANIASGRGMATSAGPTAYVGPGYPLFLALLLRLGLDPLGIALVQAVLGALTAGIAGALAGRLADAYGLVPRQWTVVVGAAAFGVALYPHLVFWTGYVLTETLFIFMVALSLYALTRAVASASSTWTLGAGAVAGLAAIIRAPFLAIGLVLVGWWLLRAARLPAAGGVVLPVLFALGLALPVLGWTARNAAVIGAPVVTSTESGYVFYQGNSREATGGSRGYVDAQDFRPLVLPAGLSEVERDEAYLRQALRDIAADPLATIARWPTKLANMWRPTYEGASLRNWLVTVVSYLPVLALGVAGALLLARRGFLEVAALPVIFIVTWAFIHVLITGMIRFRLPAELMLVITMPFAVVPLLSGRGNDGDKVPAT